MVTKALLVSNNAISVLKAKYINIFIFFRTAIYIIKILTFLFNTAITNFITIFTLTLSKNHLILLFNNKLFPFLFGL